MKSLSVSRQALSGILALACAAAVVLAMALEAEARLGPASPVATKQHAPSATGSVAAPSQ